MPDVSEWGFLNWWDSAELWLSGRPFVLQTLIVIPVVLLLAYAIAAAADVVLGVGIRGMRRMRSDRRRRR